MIKNIIFDLGGVIIKHPADQNEKFISENFGISLERASEIWRKYATSLLIGKENSKGFLEKVSKELRLNPDMDELYKKWKNYYVEISKNIDSEVLSLIKELRKKYKVYLLTDTIDTHDEHNSKRGIFNLFNKTFKSFEEGFRKPDSKAYVNVLKKIDASPEESVLIDDSEANVLSARKLGMKGIIYESKEQLVKRLHDLDVSIG